jgi:putative membrane protein insertion efficiency factor
LILIYRHLSFCQNSELLCPLKYRQVLFNYLWFMAKLLKTVLSLLLSLPVHFYRYAISPFMRPSCRHVPSCSQYMLDALKIHGPFYGFTMGFDRLLRCRPGGTHGYDPVPMIRFKKYGLFKRYKKSNRLKKPG